MGLHEAIQNAPHVRSFILSHRGFGNMLQNKQKIHSYVTMTVKINDHKFVVTI